MYDITMESMSLLGFPINDSNAINYWEDAILLVNDNKLNGSSKEGIRNSIAEGGTIKTGERTHESTAYPETVDISSHHIEMLLGDDLNDISQIFSDCENAVDRVALFYVTNRYDQGYKLSEVGYAGQEGYKKNDGTVIGSSTFDLFGKTMYDITMESMAKLGFPINDPNAVNYSENAILIVNDTKLNGSSKEWVRQGITEGGAIPTGERAKESTAYPETVDISSHHIAMLLGDDLNDISQIFSESTNAVDRVALTIENMEKWGTQWIVFPNAIYGSSVNYATQYGFSELFDYFDYTDENSEAWKLYE
jgi:predicted secreted acid phosphatase